MHGDPLTACASGNRKCSKFKKEMILVMANCVYFHKEKSSTEDRFHDFLLLLNEKEKNNSSLLNRWFLSKHLKNRYTNSHCELHAHTCELGTTTGIVRQRFILFVIVLFFVSVKEILDTFFFLFEYTGKLYLQLLVKNSKTSTFQSRNFDEAFHGA